MISPVAAAPIAASLRIWSRSADRAALVALALGVALLAVALVPRGPRWLGAFIDLPSAVDVRRRRRFLTVASFAAAFLSLGYIALYLRGGPRAADASGYWLQGRALSHGWLAWPVPDPTASFRARDLVFRMPDKLAGSLPPGFPLLLAAGFVVGAPMLIGPLVAAVLVPATWWLAHEVAADAGEAPARAEGIARVAAGLSIVSASLRYHTADVLPYGATAAAVAAATACALRARRTGRARALGACGIVLGLLVAIRPAAALPVGVAAAVLGAGVAPRGRSLAWLLAAVTPGALLLLAANHAATGHAFVFPAVAGAAAEEPAAAHARTALSAWGCLRDHLLDVANLEPLALLAVAPLLRVRRRGTATIALIVAGQVALQLSLAARLPPRQAADGLIAVVPLEHVLVALGLARLVPRAFAHAAVATFGVALAGFALRASPVHAELARADLGRPSFEPDVLREAGVAHGLLFFDDDSGYELASDPGVSPSHGVVAVRMLGDDNDRLLYDSLGHPAAHRYVAKGAAASVIAWVPPGGPGERWRFEAESEAPPLATSGGTAQAVDPPNPCASGARVLRLAPRRGSSATALLSLPVPNRPPQLDKAVWSVTPRIVEQAGGGSVALAVEGEAGGLPLAQWSWSSPPAAAAPTVGAPQSPTASPASGDHADKVPAGRCVDLPAQRIELASDRSHAWIELRASGGPVWLDRITLERR